MDPRHSSEILDKIRELGSQIASELGLEVVDVKLQGSGRRWLLRVDVDRPGTAGTGIEDCQRLSALLGVALDDTDLIEHSYLLEVSSPGIDRPIRTAEDLRRNLGRRVVVETGTAIEGRRAFCGVLAAVEVEGFRLSLGDGEEVRIPLRDVTRAQQDPGF